MGSPNWVLLIVQFSILKNLAGLTITLGDFDCRNQGTYSQNSAYQRNLNETLYALNDTYNGKGFFKKSSESAQADQTSTVYALALCLGDYYVGDCFGCVSFAITQLRQDCPYQKKATGWYNGICILSYSNSTLDMANDNENNIIPFRTNYIQDWDSLLGTLGNLFTQVWGQAHIDANNKTSHSSSITLPQSTGTIEATMQCIPNISQNICDECLVNATIHILTCCSRSAQVLVFYRYTCLLRYVIYSVKTEESLAPPPANRTTNSPPGKKTSNVIGPVVAAAVVTLGISMLLICIKFLRSCRKKGEEEELFDESDDETGEIIYYRLNEITAATRNFSVANKLGEGGFGPVYLGELSDGKRIAVKRLSQNSSQGRKEFKTEVKLIIKLQHTNLVRILGCCMKGKERLLVYEYMSNSSLDKYLFDPTRAKELNWAKRVIIVNGIAKGLRYLHEDSRLKIIHRDLKASNVLLDDEMNPKISDFGTAKIFVSNQVEANTDRVVGTYGYMAPEYAMDGMFSIKSDVYSFGVLLLEIISGKRNSRLFQQEHDQNLRSYAWMLWEAGKGDELIDENLNDDCPIEEALKWLRIALLCIEVDPTDRPTMSSVAHMLEGEWISLSEPKPPKLVGEIITSNLSSSTWNGDDFEFSLSTETAHKGKSVEKY